MLVSYVGSSRVRGTLVAASWLRRWGLAAFVVAFSAFQTGCGYVNLSMNPLNELPNIPIQLPSFLKGAQMVPGSAVAQVTSGSYVVTSEIGLYASGAPLSGGSTVGAATYPLVTSGGYRVYQSAQSVSYAR